MAHGDPTPLAVASRPSLGQDRATRAMRRVRYVDTHTEGEPTRVVVEGGPALGGGSLAERRERFGQDHDPFRRFVLDPPRGSAELVGALLTPPSGPSAFGAIFFNNVGTLGMCGHGGMGVVVTLSHLGVLPSPANVTLETPAGSVTAELRSPNEVTLTNVPSYRLRADVRVDVPGVGSVIGDVAWGGNWFFLVDGELGPLDIDHAPELIERTRAIRRALDRAGITGEGGAPIDHVERSAAPRGAHADARNFVLCPGDEYDRSPCGTGTSAKIACLVADQRL